MYLLIGTVQRGILQARERPKRLLGTRPFLHILRCLFRVIYYLGARGPNTPRSAHDFVGLFDTPNSSLIRGILEHFGSSKRCVMSLRILLFLVFGNALLGQGSLLRVDGEEPEKCAQNYTQRRSRCLYIESFGLVM